LHLYSETITDETYTVTLDGKPAAISQNGRGEFVSTWENEYGFVPVTHTKHRDLGLLSGAPPYMGVIHKINEINDLASIINDGARKQVEMPLVATGVRPGAEITYGGDNSTDANDPSDTPKKDELRVLNLPGKDSDLKAISPTISLADANSVVQAVLEEIERDLPELALHRVRAGGNLTAPGVTASYDDAASRIIEARGSYDGGLVEAQQMAVSIGGFRGYDGYASFNLDSRTNGDTDHRISDRPVVSDVLSRAERIDKTIAATSSPAAKVLLTEMAYEEKQIEQIVEAIGQQTDLFATQVGETATEDEEATVTPNDLLEANQL
jgi:hypothetical protein